MVAKKRKSSTLWLWAISGAAVMSLSGCEMYPAKPGAWPSGVWGDLLKFVSNVMNVVAHLFGNNYGISLIIVTILVRLVVLPLMVRQIRYQKMMQTMQPKIAKIREQHRGDSQKINEETMKLWQEHGINPAAGCLPMVIQLPILYALFGAIRGNPELNKYTFLWIFNLGQPDHYYILPVLAAVTTFLSSRVMMVGQDTKNTQSRMMLFIMPVMVLVLGIRFPSGLALYWIVSNLFTAAQTYFIRVRPDTKTAGAVAVAEVGPSRPKPQRRLGGSSSGSSDTSSTSTPTAGNETKGSGKSGGKGSSKKGPQKK